MVTRRGFVHSALALAARVWGAGCLGGAAAGFPVVRAAGAGGPAPPAEADRILGCLRARNAARRIGAAYLARLERRPNPVEVLDDLAGGLPPAGASRAALRRALRERIRADFASHRVVQVEGWYLAETELRLCVLATCCGGGAAAAAGPVAGPAPAR